MDWPRIKSILIVALLMTNILLGVMIINEQSTFQKERSEQLNSLRTLLEQKGIHILQKDLKFARQMTLLTVEYDQYSEMDILVLLGEKFLNDGSRFFNAFQSITFEGTKMNFGEAEHEKALSDINWDVVKENIWTLDTERTKAICDQFLKPLNRNKDYQYDQIKQTNGYTYIHAKQIENDYFLDDSSMTFVLYNDKVVAFSRKWLNIIDNNSQSKYDIIPVDRALYLLMQNFKEGDVIKEVAIGYKLNDSSLLVSNLVSGEALPYYKISLETGEVMYVQAVSSEQ